MGRAPEVATEQGRPSSASTQPLTFSPPSPSSDPPETGSSTAVGRQQPGLQGAQTPTGKDRGWARRLQGGPEERNAGDVQPMAWGELREAPGGDARKGLEAGLPATRDFLPGGGRMGVAASSRTA